MGSCVSLNKAVASNKVLPTFDEEKDYLGQLGYSKILKNRDGVELFAYFWPANANVPLKGIIQLAHGSAAYTCFDFLRYKGPGLPNVYEGSWVETFNQAGFSVCGLDHQGYGRSKGARFGIKFQTHVDNLLMLSGDVLENDNTAFPKGLPYFLVGHSLGGLLATLACLHQPQLFTGLILLSPLLSLDRPIAKRNNSLRLGLKSRPKWDDGEGSMASERPVPWLYDAWAADPLVHDGGLFGSSVSGGSSSSTSNINSSSRAEEDLSFPAAQQLAADGVLEGLALPLLVFQSEKDTCVPPEGARTLYERAASADKTLRWLSQQWHVLTKEEGWEAVLEEVSAWLAARATNSGALTRGLGETQRTGSSTRQEADRIDSATAAATAAAAQETEGKEEEEKEAAAAAALAPGAEDEAAAMAAVAVEGERAERNSVPLMTRSLSLMERTPEHEPLPSAVPAAAAAGRSAVLPPPLPMRHYSFNGRLPRAIAAPGDTTPAASGASLAAGPLPPLAPMGQRRMLGLMPAELASSYNNRGRLPPLPSLAPLLDRKPLV